MIIDKYDYDNNVVTWALIGGLNHALINESNVNGSDNAYYTLAQCDSP